MEHIVEVFQNNTWNQCKFQDLKSGDVFRVYQKEDRILYVGRAAPYIAGNDPIQKNGKWYIEIIDPENIQIGDSLNGKL